MNKKLFTLVYILTLTLSYSVYAATTFPTSTTGPGSLTGLPTTSPQTRPSADTISKESKSIFQTLDPRTKKCNFVSKKLYQPFADIDKSFPGASSVLKMDENGCVSVAGATENIIKLLFTTGITIIIILTVISISVSGIQYMTEEAVGKKGEAKKRLTNSFIALALGLLSYTILYTINKQLVEFSFDPASIDYTGAVSEGISDTNSSASTTSGYYANIAGIEAMNQPSVPYSQINNLSYSPTSPTGWINPYTKTPCSPQLNGTASSTCVKESTLMDVFNNQPGLMGGTNMLGVITVNLLRKEGGLGEGTISLNGISYNVRSGPWGNGYLPVGQYTLTHGDFSVIENGQNIRSRRETPKSMTVPDTTGRYNNGVFGYSFNISDKFDPRTGVTRGLLRIHPDGYPNGTEGCVGIIGDVYTQERFFQQLSNLLNQNGGSYTLIVK